MSFDQDDARFPFEGVSELARFVETDLDGPSPMRGLTVERLEDVVNVHGRLVRDELYRRSVGISYEDGRRANSIF